MGSSSDGSARLRGASGRAHRQPRPRRGARRWQPKLDTDAVKLLGSLVLLHYGQGSGVGAPVLRRAADDDEQGKMSVRYPRGAQAEKELHREATERLMRARTPEDALAVVLRLLLAQRLVDKDGLPGADRQGVCEPQELAGSKVLNKLAKRVAPPSVKKHLAEREAEREHREQSWREEKAAKLAEQRANPAAREPVRCSCCFQSIASLEDAAEKHGRLVHRGECEQQWGSAQDVSRVAGDGSALSVEVDLRGGFDRHLSRGDGEFAMHMYIGALRRGWSSRRQL